MARGWTVLGMWALGAMAVGAPAPVGRGPAAAWKASAETPFGWRGDGSGRFPSADPVTQWSPTQNITWRTPMPDWSVAQPAIAGAVLLVCSEPTTLLCVRRSDGKVLWQKSHNYEDLLPPADGEQVKKDLQAAERIRVVELEPIKRKIQDVNRQLQGLPDDRYLRSTKSSLENQRKAVEARLVGLEKWRPPKADPMLGHSHPTPVTDGAGVFAVFGNGVGAVYDLEGVTRWARVIRRAQIGCGAMMSPILAGEVLVMGIDNEVLAVKAATGEDVWRYEVKQPTAGLAAAKVGDVRVVITAEGEVLRASDGKLLAQVKGAARPGPAAPVVNRDVFYLLGDGSQLLVESMAPNGSGGVQLARLSTVRLFEGSYLGACLYQEGSLYLWEKANVLNVISARSGRAAATRRLTLGGAAWSSPTLAGEFIFLGADSGTMAVIRPKMTRGPGGRMTFEAQEVARNALEPFRGSPVFAGRDMYLRTLKSLYCIGPGSAVDARQPGPATRPKPKEIDIDELLR